MENNALDSSLVSPKSTDLLENPDLGEETVILEAAHQHTDDLVLDSGNVGNNVFISTQEDVNLNDFDSKVQQSSESIIRTDQLMNNTANTSSLEGPDNIFGLFEDSNRHTTEVKSNNKISCSPVTGKLHIAKENESSHNIKEESSRDSRVTIADPIVSSASSEMQVNGSYYQINAPTFPSNVSADNSYEVSTFVTEDGQTGQIIISSNGHYPANLNASITNGLPLSDNEITNSAEDQVMPLPEETIEEIAGFENFSGGIPVTGTAADYEYVMKQVSGNQENPKKVYQCIFEGCKKQFSTSSRLKAHCRIHTGDTFICAHSLCGKVFVTQSDLQKHSKSHLGRKDFVCEVEGCGKEYTTIHHLKVHKRQHSGERPFVCEWDGCGKMFTTGYGLKSHFRTHTNERPYKCQHQFCTKAFKTSGDLQKHLRTHTGERPFLCPYSGCGRSFTTSNIRKVHYRTHTGEKPYKCEIEGCGREFASATNYKNHSRIHTGERPYVCEVAGCMRRFTEYSSLYKHNIVHTQQKPYVCTLCGKTYRQTSTLAMHKRTAHGTDDLTESERDNGGAKYPFKRPKMSQKQRIPSMAITELQPSAYIQGMSLVIDNSSGDVEMPFSAELASSQINEPGAITIPIQVTVNPDGTIAGAQGLNLTDGTGRMIPVNLSVSLPVTNLVEDTTETMNEKVEQYKVPVPDTVSSELVIQDTTDTAEASNNGPDKVLRSIGIQSDIRLNAKPVKIDLPTITSYENCVSYPDPKIGTQSQQTLSYDIEADDRDVTDKYLTSHFTKEGTSET